MIDCIHEFTEMVPVPGHPRVYDVFCGHCGARESFRQRVARHGGASAHLVKNASLRPSLRLVVSNPQLDIAEPDGKAHDPLLMVVSGDSMVTSKSLADVTEEQLGQLLRANLYPASDCGRCGEPQAVSFGWAMGLGWAASCGGCDMPIPAAYVTFVTAEDLASWGWHAREDPMSGWMN